MRGTVELKQQTNSYRVRKPKGGISYRVEACLTKGGVHLHRQLVAWTNPGKQHILPSRFRPTSHTTKRGICNFLTGRKRKRSFDQSWSPWGVRVRTITLLCKRQEPVAGTPPPSCFPTQAPVTTVMEHSIDPMHLVQQRHNCWDVPEQGVDRVFNRSCEI